MFFTWPRVGGTIVTWYTWYPSLFDGSLSKMEAQQEKLTRVIKKKWGLSMTVMIVWVAETSKPTTFLFIEWFNTETVYVQLI